jgi:hypothetical protein
MLTISLIAVVLAGSNPHPADAPLREDATGVHLSPDGGGSGHRRASLTEDEDPKQRRGGLIGAGAALLGLTLVGLVAAIVEGVYSLGTVIRIDSRGGPRSGYGLDGLGFAVIVELAVAVVSAIAGAVLLSMGLQTTAAPEQPEPEWTPVGAGPSLEPPAPAPTPPEVPNDGTLAGGRCSEEEIAKMRAAGMSERAIYLACVAP